MYAVSMPWRCVSVVAAAKAHEPTATLARVGGTPGTLTYTGPWAGEFELGRCYRLIRLEGEGRDACLCGDEGRGAEAG